MAAKRKTWKDVVFVKGTYFDYPSLFFVVFLVMFGLMMIFSASSFVANRDFGNSTHYVVRQFVFSAIGFAGAYVVSKIRYQIFRNFTWPAYFAELLLLAAVFIMGTATNGSTRWLKIAGVTFQPSEIAKLVIILYMAHVCSTRVRAMETIKGTLEIMAPAFIFIGAIAIENLSTAIICAGIAAGIWVIVTPKLRYVFIVGIIIVSGGALMIALQSYRGDRITAWLHPETSEHGYQTMQGLYAIGSGGLFGRGLGQSIQKLGFIPEAQNDMIFSIICEELGLFGAILVLLLFGYLLYRLYFIAKHAADVCGTLVVSGIFIHIALQVVLNICVNLNLIPTTGVTLPFVSYGGTSVIFTMIEIGLALNVAKSLQPDPEPEEDFM